MTPPPAIPPTPPSEHKAGYFVVEDILAAVRAKARLQRHNTPHCPIAPRELPPGTRLQRYRLLRVLGQGGFGVTYLAEDEEQGRRVVLKEHFPEYLCHRESNTLHVKLASEEHRPAYEAACRGFLRECRLLADIAHPHIVRVHDSFEELNTAYHVSDYINGISLGDMAQDYALRGMRPPQQKLQTALVQLLEALAYLHNRDLLHRDIKPDNILMDEDGRPVLIDFGAAHELRSTRPAHIVQSPGFSPSEQSKPDGEMGPWTDLYALGATFHYLITGNVPPASHKREQADTSPTLAEQDELRAHYHPSLLSSIDRATRPLPHERYQCAEEWLAALAQSSVEPGEPVA